MIDLRKFYIVELGGLIFTAIGVWVSLKQLELALSDKQGPQPVTANPASNIDQLADLPWNLSYNIPDSWSADDSLNQVMPVYATNPNADDSPDNSWPSFNQQNRL